MTIEFSSPQHEPHDIPTISNKTSETAPLEIIETLPVTLQGGQSIASQTTPSLSTLGLVSPKEELNGVLHKAAAQASLCAITEVSESIPQKENKEELAPKPTKPPPIVLDDELEPEIVAKAKVKTESKRKESPQRLDILKRSLDTLIPLSTGTKEQKAQAEESLYKLTEEVTTKQLFKGLLPDGLWESDIPNGSELIKLGLQLRSDDLILAICNTVELLRNNLEIAVSKPIEVTPAASPKIAQKRGSVNFEASMPSITPRTRSPLAIDIAKCSLDELTQFLQTNKEKRYYYQILYLLQDLESYSKSPNLTVDDLASIKCRLNLLCLCNPYQTKTEAELPKRIPWPPIGTLARHDEKKMLPQIASLYCQTFGNILSGLSKLKADALRADRVVDSADIDHLLSSASVFNFSDLLTYAVVTGHVDLLVECLSNFESKVVDEFDSWLSYDQITNIQFMTRYGAQEFEKIYPLVDDLLILYELAKCKNVQDSLSMVKTYIQRGGDVLHQPYERQDLLTTYAEHDNCQPEILALLSARAKDQIAALLGTLDTKNPSLCIEYLCRLAELPNLPANLARACLLMIAELKMKCKNAGDALPPFALNLLDKAKAFCLKAIRR